MANPSDTSIVKVGAVTFGEPCTGVGVTPGVGLTVGVGVGVRGGVDVGVGPPEVMVTNPLFCCGEI